MMFLPFLISYAFASTNIGPTAFPVFLREGFSSILEFEEAPTQVVLGDQNLFQVERLNRSIVIKPLTPYATTNMFVYFKTKETKLFLLSSSEESEPTYYKKFESIVIPTVQNSKAVREIKYSYGLHILSTQFDKKKDYLTIDYVIAADSKSKVVPNWDLIRLKYKDRTFSPSKSWSERKEIQRDSYVKARLIFIKPNIPEDLKAVSVLVPLKGTTKTFNSDLKGKR